MTDAHRLPRAIQWHEGMLLAPQHFQQQALRHEELLHYHTVLMAPFHWGVRRFAFDPGMLVNGTLRVLELEAIMPDGLVVSHTQEDADTLEVDLTPHVEGAAQTALTVHLAVIAADAGGDPDGRGGRYTSLDGEPVLDANTGQGDLRIPRLTPRVCLLVAETPPKRYVAFPLARVNYQDQTFSMTDFVPPALTVSVQSPLGTICARVIQRLREKATFLSDKVRTSASTLELPLILETRAQIHSLVSALPQFEGVLHTGASHPYALYLCLCALMGDLAALGPGLVPPAPPAYDHSNLRSVFGQAQAFVLRMMEEGILEAYTAVAFLFEKGVFGVAFQEAWMSRTLVLGARGQDGQTEDQVVSWIEGCLVGSVSRVDGMRDKRILGARRTQITGEEDLVAARGVVFFALQADREFIVPDELLQVFNREDVSGARRPAELILYVKNAS